MKNQILEIHFLKAYRGNLSMYWASLSEIISDYVYSAELFQSHYVKIVFSLRLLPNAKNALKIIFTDIPLISRLSNCIQSRPDGCF